MSSEYQIDTVTSSSLSQYVCADEHERSASVTCSVSIPIKKRVKCGGNKVKKHTTLSSGMSSACAKKRKKISSERGSEHCRSSSRALPTLKERKPPPFFYYTDYSRDPDDDPLTPLTPVARVPNFPAKMHAILTRADLKDLIDWMPHGRAWKILKPRQFEVRVLPHYFNHSKISSFISQANAWGFRRVTQGRDQNAYYHELFLRSLPHLCKRMRRPGVSEKPALNADHLPEFYKISEIYPVPEKPIEDESIFLQHTLKGGPKARVPVHCGLVPPKGSHSKLETEIASGGEGSCSLEGNCNAYNPSIASRPNYSIERNINPSLLNRISGQHHVTQGSLQYVPAFRQMLSSDPSFQQLNLVQQEKRVAAFLQKSGISADIGDGLSGPSSECLGTRTHVMLPHLDTNNGPSHPFAPHLQYSSLFRDSIPSEHVNAVGGLERPSSVIVMPPRDIPSFAAQRAHRHQSYLSMQDSLPTTTNTLRFMNQSTRPFRAVELPCSPLERAMTDSHYRNALARANVLEHFIIDNNL